MPSSQKLLGFSVVLVLHNSEPSTVLKTQHSPIQALLLPLIVLGIFLTITPAQALRVVIDAGHGGHDRGAVSGPVYEKHLALDTARRLERYLKRRGVDVTMVRSNDKFVTLDNRVAVGNRFSNAIFVSIHYNSASNRDATGIETFYYTSQSGRLAGFVQYNIIKKMGLVDRGVKHRGFRVIKYSRNPSILVECGFLSNTGERRNCLSPNYRQKMAEAIGYGIIRYNRER